MLHNKDNWLEQLFGDLATKLNNNYFSYIYSSKYNNVIANIVLEFKKNTEDYNHDNDAKLIEHEQGTKSNMIVKMINLFFKDNNPIDIDFNQYSYKKSFEQCLDKISIKLILKNYLFPDLKSYFWEISEAKLSQEKESNNLINKNATNLNNYNFREIHSNLYKEVTNLDIVIWRDSQSFNLYYRLKQYGCFQKTNKYKLADSLSKLLNKDIVVYESSEYIKERETNYLLISLFSIVKSSIFNPQYNKEFIYIQNDVYYKNIFQYTSFLQKRVIPIKKQKIESHLQPVMNDLPKRNLVLTDQQRIRLHNPIKSMSYDQDPPHLKLKKLQKSIETKDSIIKNFISNLSKNEYQNNYIMDWLANFFQTLHQSSMAFVLIGDSKTTEMLINKIIKPIFTYKKEYFSVVNEETLKKANDTIIKDKIFYHIDTDNLSKENIKSNQLSNLLLELIKPNSSDLIKAIENNETYIHGETVVTSSNESPYPFLKNSYSRCSVFSVANIHTILKKMDLDLLQLVEFIESDLDNFSNILAQYQTNNYYTTAQTAEKNVLSKMKKGVLITSDLEEKIQLFVSAVKRKDVWYFKKLEQENDKNLYKELVENFDNDDAIYQPLLSEYFNIVNGDIIFSDNSYFIEILKERECLFNQAADDKFKRNGQRRYKIYKYKLAKNYQGNCQDIL